ncbi:MAG: hypothetical protein AAFO82_06055, partial [Bacteroidota bacterium]
MNWINAGLVYFCDHQFTTMDLKAKVQQLASDYHSEIVDIRRHLHQNPELSFQEVETGKFIAQKLEEYGIPHEHGSASISPRKAMVFFSGFFPLIKATTPFSAQPCSC